MKKVLCSFLFLVVIQKFSALQAQILTVSTGSDVTILPGTPFFVDSLLLIPSSTFTLSDISLIRNTVVSFQATNPYIARVYKFSENSNAFSGDVQMFYRDGVELNGLSENTLQLNVHNGVAWQFYNSEVNDVVNNYVLTITLSNSQLNELTLAASGSPLPLQWRSFIAIKRQENVLLKWSTFSEQSSKYFIVQTSADGIRWNSLATIAAAGSSGSASNYNYLHISPANGYNFYRILETDADGKQNYSIIQKIFFVFPRFHLELLGNPVTNRMLMVRVNLARSNDKAPILRIYASDGKLLLKQQAFAGINKIRVNTLAQGAYFLEADGITIKFLIQ